MNLIIVPQTCQKEKVNRLKLKIFLIGHIYEVKIIRDLCNLLNKYSTVPNCRTGPNKRTGVLFSEI